MLEDKSPQRDKNIEGLGQPIPLCVANVSADYIGLNSLC